MANLTTVGLTSGAGTSGTGNVSTLDNVIGTAGTGSTNVLTVQGAASGTALPVSLATAPTTTVVGNVASGSVDSGNGVKVSGVYNTTLPTLTATDRADLQTDVAGNIRVAMVLPNGVAGSDGVSNSNVGFLRTNTGQSSIGLPIAGNYVFNGTTWDRQRSGTDTGSIIVDQATAANLNATVFPSAAATWGIGTATQNSASATNGRMALGQFNTTPTTITSGNMSPLQMDSAGNLLVNVKTGGGSGGTSSTFGSAFPTTGTAIGLTNGTNMVGWSATTNYGTAPSAIAVPAVNAYITNANANGQTTMSASAPVVIASNQSAIPTTTATATTGGTSTTVLIAANTTNATSLKTSAGTLYGIQVFNNSTTIGYLKLYNKASSPTVGTDTPIKVIMIPVSSGVVVTIPEQGVAFSTGIAYAVTGGIANSDTTVVAASAFIINIDYA